MIETLETTIGIILAFVSGIGAALWLKSKEARIE
jgi:hypothetical protein